MAHAMGINYHMDMDGIQEILPILCNPTEIREICINIINNALDAMPDGGCMSFKTWNNKDTVFISISDNGNGMSEEVKNNVLEPSFTTTGTEGTGLGMNISYGIICRHGGRIEIKSEVNNGSTFTLHFPIPINTDSVEETSEVEKEVISKKLRILVVDDNVEIGNILDKFLSREGHLVRIVNNGEEAKVLAKIDNYDLVLCDFVIPEGYGINVINSLNELEKRPKIGIVTGWGEKLKGLEDNALKVDFVLIKPFKHSELTKQINDLFGADGR